jgi:hypothetical protein
MTTLSPTTLNHYHHHPAPLPCLPTPDQPPCCLANLPGLSATTPYPNQMAYPPQTTVEDTLTGIFPKFGQWPYSMKCNFILFYFYFLFFI